jgi:hypothetical protein
MPAFLIPLAIAAASAVYQGIKGAKQKAAARKMQEEANGQYRQNLDQANRFALAGMPEAEYQKALQGIYRNQATSLSSLRDRRSALAGAPAVQQSTNDAILGLSSQDAQMRRQAQNAALGQANQYASHLANNAMNERQSGEALTGAALSNLYNTGTTAAYMSSMGGEDHTFDFLKRGYRGTFGTNPAGMQNRSILGSSPIYGSGLSTPSSALYGPMPKSIDYSKPY